VLNRGQVPEVESANHQQEDTKMRFRIALSGVLLLASSFVPVRSYGQATADNPSVTAQLEAAKPLVAKIKKDAIEMQSYSLVSGPSWSTHAATLTRIKDDVNKLQENTRGLQSHRTAASPWQQDAIDRITALANDLATNMSSAIDHLNKNKTRPSSPPYPEYLKTNTRLVTALGDEIDATIDAGDAKAKEEALTKQLDDSGK
jgi:hypothetical protein